MAILASSCTFTLTHEGVTAACTPLEFRINTHGVALSTAQLAAVDGAVAEYGTLVGRTVHDLGSTGAVVRNHRASDPILIEVSWPDGAPPALGYSEPAVVGGRFVGGWMMLNPLVRHLTPGMLRRLVLHELGHLLGLGDVSARDELMNPALTTASWGAGDLAGLSLTHDGGCRGSNLAVALRRALD